MVDSRPRKVAMKFRAERAQFAEAVAWAQRTVGDRVSMPGLAGIRMTLDGDQLVLESTNIEVDSRVSLTVQGDTGGRVLVSGKLLADVVRALPQDAVNLQAVSDLLRLQCGRAQFELRLMTSDDFPSLREPSTEAPVATMKAEEFAATVAQVARSSSTDDARPVLTGVNLEATQGRLTAAATDSYRLAVRSVPWDRGAEMTVLVPRRALEQARHAADALGSEVKLVLEPQQVTFEFSDRRLVTRLIDGRFPDYRALIPTEFEREATVDRAELAEVVKRVAVMSDLTSTVTPVQLHVTEDTLTVRAASAETGNAEEALPCELRGEPLEIAFNPRYLSDGLDAVGTEEVLMQFRDPLKPAVLRPAPSEPGADTRDFLYLLMPVRL